MSDELIGAGLTVATIVTAFCVWATATMTVYAARERNTRYTFLMALFCGSCALATFFLASGALYYLTPES